jgi:hypothetical protein
MMMTPPPPVTLTIRLDDSPRYRGSVHDDEVAKRMGYRAALVPGAFLYGHFSRLAVDLWGRSWIETGAMAATFRRPVYNGDDVGIEAVPDSEGTKLALTMLGPDGQLVAEGWIAPPATMRVPEPALWPMLAVSDDRPEIADGRQMVGLRGTTAGAILTQDDIATSRAAFDERHPIYEKEGLAHPGLLMRRAMFEVNGSFRWPGPVVLTGCEAQHFAPVAAGMRLETSSVIGETFERRGKSYVVTDELVLADGRPAALFRRTQLYAQGAG